LSSSLLAFPRIGLRTCTRLFLARPLPPLNFLLPPLPTPILVKNQPPPRYFQFHLKLIPNSCIFLWPIQPLLPQLQFPHHSPKTWKIYIEGLPLQAKYLNPFSPISFINQLSHILSLQYFRCHFITNRKFFVITKVPIKTGSLWMRR